jgi:hypothetical protein
MDVQTILMIATPVASVGAAWGGAKVALNGTRLRVKELEQADRDKTDRLARIETKIDMLLEKR